jgi:hypothetical protein
MPKQENDMTRLRMLYGPLLAASLLSACVVGPARGPDYVVAPALPVIVELDLVPYYHGGYYYHYRHRDNRWIYSRSQTGPWHDLPRDRYPREIRYKDRDRDRDRNRGRDRNYR